MTREKTSRDCLFAALTVAALLAMFGCCAPTITETPQPPTGFSNEAVQRAIQRGREYLLDTQDAKGAWPETQSKDGQRTAATALAIQALLTSDNSRRKEPRLAKALEYLAKNPTYRTYDLALRCCAWQMAIRRYGRDYERALYNDAAKLMIGMKRQGSGGYAYDCDPCSNVAVPVDNLITMYGVMGVWAATEADAEIPMAYWRGALRYWLGNQNADGGWGLGSGQPSIATTTAGGLAMLHASIRFCCSGAFLRGDRRADILRPQRNALAWMDKNLPAALADPKDQFIGSGGLYPFLHAVQLAGQVTGRKYFGGADVNMECGGADTAFDCVTPVRTRRPSHWIAPVRTRRPSPTSSQSADFVSALQRLAPPRDRPAVLAQGWGRLAVEYALQAHCERQRPLRAQGITAGGADVNMECGGADTALDRTRPRPARAASRYPIQSGVCVLLR